MDISPPLTSNLPDIVSKDNLNGKKRILDLNAWLDGLKPEIKVWEDEGEDDDDSTQRDEDSNYDSDSGESSVTVTSVVSNKSFSVSLADLCNFAGEVYDSENDSDEWQSTGRRSVSLSSDISGFSYVSVLPTEELDKLIQDVKSIGDNNLQDYEDVRVVVLHKDIGVGLGFSLAGGVDQNKPVTVHKVFHSGVAAQEASIKEGDQVLSINGSALSGCTHWEALRVLRRAKGREMGVVVLKKPDVRVLSKEKASAPDLTPPQISETGQRVTVSLEKSNRDLGFSLEGGVGSSLGNKPLSVQKIFQGGPFEKVLPGDEVLEVNGVSVVGMRRLEAWTLIRKLPPGPVSVVLRRNPHMT
uniref:PDZ domain-containing protein n=1 Tax=Knipowitschia caucasica TaxID=637954 RepID=A0AAV2MD18_KNICA